MTLKIRPALIAAQFVQSGDVLLFEGKEAVGTVISKRTGQSGTSFLVRRPSGGIAEWPKTPITETEATVWVHVPGGQL